MKLHIVTLRPSIVEWRIGISSSNFAPVEGIFRSAAKSNEFKSTKKEERNSKVWNIDIWEYEYKFHNLI